MTDSSTNNIVPLSGQEVELTMHDGTVRDLCFLEDTSNKSSLLISGGAGDCKIYVTDCATGTPFQALSGHSGHVLTLYNWGGAMFVSGSQDKTVRFWDLRTRGCVNMVTPATVPGSRVSLVPLRRWSCYFIECLVKNLIVEWYRVVDFKKISDFLQDNLLTHRLIYNI